MPADLRHTAQARRGPTLVDPQHTKAPSAACSGDLATVISLG